MLIDQHISMIVNKYNLKYHYNKYIITSILSTIIREGYYWLLIYYNDIIKENPDKLKQVTILLLITYGLKFTSR
jgi:hypothetical protein